MRTRLISIFAALGRAASVDPDFYRRYYGDLEGKGRFQCVRHYIDFGRDEGRFPNYDAAREGLEFRHGALPPGFDPTVYALLNPDLGRVLTGGRHLTLHYIEHGRRESRRHAPDPANEPFWEALLRPADYLAWSAPHGAAPVSRRDAAASFLRQGVPDLSPLALDLVFDPIFFRAVHRPDSDASDADLYRAWLDGGLVRGEAPNEAKALDPMLAGECLPPSFDWIAYRAGLPVRVARRLRTRLDAVRHAFEADDTGSPPSAGAEMDLLIARDRYRRRLMASAERRYERVLATTGATGEAIGCCAW